MLIYPKDNPSSLKSILKLKDSSTSTPKTVKIQSPENALSS